MDATAQAQQAAQKARRLSTAFHAVFGQSGHRTSDQRIVMEHLRKIGCADALIFQNSPNGGPFDPLAAAHRDGARSIILVIERQLQLAREENEKPKPKTQR